MKMKKLLNIPVTMLLVLTSFSLMAQKSGKGGKAAADSVKPPKVYTFLGSSALDGGTISKYMFDSLLKQGVSAKDSTGTPYPIDGFTFSYAERNLYEDSVGRLMMLTDYFSEFCPGDTVSLAIKRNIYYKTKAGDTAYFENVKVRTPQGGQVIAKPMRFVLTK